jgi:hypothetical protein
MGGVKVGMGGAALCCIEYRRPEKKQTLQLLPFIITSPKAKNSPATSVVFAAGSTRQHRVSWCSENPVAGRW